MALNEYKPGTAFPGRMGRTIDESEPAWPAPRRAREGAPNVLFIVLDDTGFGQLGCYGRPIKTPNLDKLAKNGLRYNNMHTTALCSPIALVHPHRPQPPLQRHGLHHRGLDRLSRRQRHHPVRERLPVRDAARSTATTPIAIGKWHLTPAEQISAAGPYDRWPLGRGFERYYGFLGGDTTSTTRSSSTTTPGRAAEDAGGGLSPDRGPGRTRRSSSSPTSSRSRRTSRSSCTSAPAPCTRRTTCRRNGPTSTRASSTTAGTPIARRCSPSRSELGIMPAGHQAVAATIRTCRTGPSCRPTSASSTRG